MEFHRDPLGRQAFRLVHRKHDGTSRAAQQVGDRAILPGQALAAVDEEDHDIGLRDRDFRLSGHRLHDPAPRLGLEAASVDDEVRPVAAPAASIVAVAREPGKIRDQRRARSGQAIEERRLADIGPADEDESGEHGMSVVVARKVNS